MRIPVDSPLSGKRLREVNIFSKIEVSIVGLVRAGERRLEPSALTKLLTHDILMISADTENLKKLVEIAGLELVGSEKIDKANLGSDDVTLIEAVIMPNSLLLGSTARSLNLRAEYGVNLLAVSR